MCFILETGEVFVLKQIELNVNDLPKEKLVEVKILASLNIQYVVKYYDSFIESCKLYILMEYCERMDLEEYLAKSYGLTERRIWKFFIEMCVALEHLHKRNIIHRDLKPKNVFITRDYQIRIGDLGVSASFAP